MELNDFIKNTIDFLKTQLEEVVIPPIDPELPVDPPPPSYIPSVFDVGTSVTIVDGRKAPYNSIKPGDIVRLVSGVRAPLAFMNLEGTADRPIIIKNAETGIVDINAGSGWYGFWFRNCHHFRFTGTGRSGTEYGIKITRAQSNGIMFEKKTDHFEMDHIEILRVDGTVGFGVQGQTRLTLGKPDYDFNGDGTIDIKDEVTRENYVDGDWHIHHFNIDGGVNKQMQMALYVGNSNYLEEKNPLVKNVHIHDMTIRNITTKVFQVGSVVEGFDVHDIDIRNSAQGSGSLYPMAISVNPGTNGKLYNCIIMDCGGYGIGWIGTGGHIFNNLIVRCGRPNTYFTHAIYVSYKQPWTHSEPTYIYNNTIINPVGYGILISDMLKGMRIVRNNIIVSPGKTYKSLSPGSVESNNLEVINVDAVKFTNPKLDDYSLLPDSPAIDTGYNMADLGLTEDILGNLRHLGANYDVGAYEWRE